MTGGRGDLVDAGSTNACDDVLLVRSLLALTVVTGLIEAIGFLGLGHIFTANMTGNVVFLAFALAGALLMQGFGMRAPLVAAALIVAIASFHLSSTSRTRSPDPDDRKNDE